MYFRLGFLLAILIGLAAYAGYLPRVSRELLALPEAVAPTLTAPPVLYRWKDAKGQLVYGTQPPPGVKAETVADKGSVSTVPATKIPEAPRKELPPGVTIQQLATERAIDQATGVK